MSAIAGHRYYIWFEEGKPLTRKQAMLAQCYVCNGEEESNADCQGTDCPMYQYHPHRHRTTKKGIKRNLEHENADFALSQDKGIADSD